MSIKKIGSETTLSRLVFILIISITHSIAVSAVDIPLIFPLPQEHKITKELFTVDETISVAVPVNAGEQDIFLARNLIKELSDKYGIAIKLSTGNTLPVKGKVILMGNINNSLIKEYCSKNNIRLTEEKPGPEGYILHVKNNLIVIAGWDDQGAFYGLQSLRQLLMRENGKTVQGIEVTDWPVMLFRGIRLYVPGPDNIAFYKRFLRDFMALYKYNKVIVEVNCMRLDRHPEVNAGWIEFSKQLKYSRSNSTQGVHGEEKNSSHYDAGDGYILEKSEVKDIVDYANQYFIETIPEIPSLTHAYYLLTRHPELAEYPGDIFPDTYCPSNPASYELMFDVYDEYIEVMKPKMVHIGHDEWWGAPMGVCPLCKGKDHSKLFAGDVIKIHRYFADRNIKTAMWGDYLLESVRDTLVQNRVSSTGIKYQTPGAVRPEVVRESIPKDILIFNWFWNSRQKEMDLHNFGFTQVYGNFTPAISGWNERITEFRLSGGAPSSWASTNEYTFGKDLVLDFLGCANLLWSPHVLDLHKLGETTRLMMADVRKSFKGTRIPSEDGDPVVPVDISASLNMRADLKVFGTDISSLKQGTIQSGTRVFKLSPPSGKAGNSLIAAGTETVAKNPLPSSANGIKIGADVSSLIFLHACAIPAGNQKSYFNIPNFFDSADLLGWYEVIYDDGLKEIIPIQYGVNILEWNPGGEKSLDTREGDTGSPQQVYCYEADPVICSSDSKNPVTFFAFEWVNPRFGKAIKEVNLLGSLNYQATQQNYGMVESAPMHGNAVFLAAISKVLKREPIKPR